MEDISANIFSLREAIASAVLRVSKRETIQTLLANQIPKGNVLEMAKVAGLFAVKNTHLILPQSYPVPVEFTGIDYEIGEFEIKILLTVRSVSKSNLEMHALHGALITALTIYDVLKPLDKGIQIQELKFCEKPETRSGKPATNLFDVAVVLVSNAIAKGIKSDAAGQAILVKLQACKGNVTSYQVIPDDQTKIQHLAVRLAPQNQLLIFAGGTGLARTDVTTETLEPLLDRRIPGIEEAIRSYGQSRTPYAMFSRSLAGMIGDCLVLALPGSTRGAMESMDAIFPSILHAFPVRRGSGK